MLSLLRTIFDDRPVDLRLKIAALLAGLIAANIAAWIWALTAFRDYPLLLGTALLAYGFGLRHAVDADHIAAIDNVTRKLMQDDTRPVGVGFFFSLGHSTIVVLASVVIAVSTLAFRTEVAAMKSVGSAISTTVSALFLLAIALMNVVILCNVYGTFQRAKRGQPVLDDDLNMLLAGRGLLARVFRPMFRLIRRSWQMYPLGVLFGFGFDTATEVALLGISAAQAARGMSIWSILVFPALFTAGMSLIDTLDSVLMLGAYGWAYVKPIRKLYYNMIVTFVSVLVALLVGGTEALGLLANRFDLRGGFWDGVGALNGSFGMLGYLIIALFVATWIVAALIYRLRGYDRLETVTDARVP